jgi:hypothetical protein
VIVDELAVASTGVVVVDPDGRRHGALDGTTWCRKDVAEDWVVTDVVATRETLPVAPGWCLVCNTRFLPPPGHREQVRRQELRTTLKAVWKTEYARKWARALAERDAATAEALAVSLSRVIAQESNEAVRVELEELRQVLRQALAERPR